MPITRSLDASGDLVASDVGNYEIPSDLAGTTNSSGRVIPASLYPVFRDEEELPADADLTSNIRQALENSALLVVICSPGACNRASSPKRFATSRNSAKRPHSRADDRRRTECL